MSYATYKQIKDILALAGELYPDTGLSPNYLTSYQYELGLSQREAQGLLTKWRASAIIKKLLAQKKALKESGGVSDE